MTWKIIKSTYRKILVGVASPSPWTWHIEQFSCLTFFLAFYHIMLTIFSISITIYLQQLHWNLIYIDAYQDAINYSQIDLYQNPSNMRPILEISLCGRGPAGGGAVGLRNDVSSRGSLSQRRHGKTRVGTPSEIRKVEETSFMDGPLFALMKYYK